MLAAAHDVYRTFAVVGAPDPARELCKQWQGVNAKCKDVVVLALPLKDLPVSKEAFADAAGGEFIRAQFYVVRVGPVDGQDWGWSNAPYDCAKKTPRSDLRGLYSVDESGDTKGETRFHAFKKVSNNKNKGARVEAPIEGVDTSFVLPQGSVITFFMREDAYEGSKVFVNAGDTAVVPAFTPLVLQLSGTNCEQALKGNGLKLRRIMHLRPECLTPFMADLCTSKHEALQRQELGRRYPAIANVVSRSTTPPVVCTVLPDAFVFQNEDLERRGMVELVDSGLDMDVAPVLLLPVDLMLAVLHTQDFQRAKRLFCVALGHGAVKCVVVPSEQGEAVVRHLHVDAQRMLWLDTLQQMRSSDRPAELPNNDMLVMCFGRRIGVDGSGVGFGSESPHDVLQWYNPSKTVTLAAADGRDVAYYFVFEADLDTKRSLGVAETPDKYFLMDEADGLHHSLRVFKAERVSYTPEAGLGMSADASLFLTWQLRPSQSNSDTRALGSRTSRKRPCYEPDEIDRINSLPS